MKPRQLISVIIPALNEEQGIHQTISSIPKEKLSDQGYDIEILVVDGYSTDRTGEVAEALGAKVVSERRKGYASLILKLSLEKAAELRIEKALLTCAGNNAGSFRTIEKNGGKLWKEEVFEGRLSKYYWIKIK